MRWHRHTSSASTPSGLRFIKRWGLWHHPRLLNYFAAFLAAFVAILLNLLSYHLSHTNPLTWSTPLTTGAEFLLPAFNQREQHAARRLGASRTPFSAQSAAYFLCHDCAADNGRHTASPPKLVALVELRNVAESLDSFLTALERVVDGVVALDDHSEDGTRALLLERCVRSAARPSRCKLDALIVKTGVWVRQELLDRDLLLRAGRAVGGTHFVLLDYDERFAGGCVDSGALRDAVFGLAPGHSLFLPWVELWKSPALQRVLPSDRGINFLVRRQTVVFADDGRANYSIESARARSLGAHNASIHALRCPRSVCPQPPRYRGPATAPVPRDARVHRGPHACAIAEARFIHVPNVMLKAAWYQALARVLHADSSATRGKMLDALFPAESPWGPNKLRAQTPTHAQSGIALSITPPSWFPPAQAQDILALRHVEAWRARELVHWLARLGDAQFSDLTALQYLDLNALRHAAARAFFTHPTRPWEHVPRWKRGTLAIAVGGELEADVMVQILGRFGEAVDVELNDIAVNSEFITSLGRNSFRKGLNSKALGYEDWRLSVVSKVRAALSASRNGVAYVAAKKLAADQFASLVEFASKEFDEFDVVFVFATGAREMEKVARENDNADKLKCAVNASLKPGSHVRVLAINSVSLGSYSAVTWLRYRITGKAAFSGEGERKELLALTEKINARLRERYKTETEVMPVARMIFSLNVGRSGSKYLAGMFSSLGRAVRGLHEPRCADNKCSGGGAIAMQYKKLEDTYEERHSVKMRMLENAMIAMGEQGVKDVVEMENVGYQGECVGLIERQAGVESRVVIETNSETGCSGGWLKHYVYAETNPNFKSWFYDVTLDTMPRRGYSLSVIVLRKYHAAALKSLYETGYFSYRNGYNWMETGNGVNARVRAIRSDREMDAFDKIISYLFNAEAVMRHVVQRYSAIARFIEVRSEDIYSEKGTIELLRRLGLARMHLTASTLELAGRRADKYATEPGHAKRRMITSIHECERRIATYLATSASLRITSIPPNMTQLTRYRGFTYL